MIIGFSSIETNICCKCKRWPYWSVEKSKSEKMCAMCRLTQCVFEFIRTCWCMLFVLLVFASLFIGTCFNFLRLLLLSPFRFAFLLFRWNRKICWKHEINCKSQSHTKPRHVLGRKIFQEFFSMTRESDFRFLDSMRFWVHRWALKILYWWRCVNVFISKWTIFRYFVNTMNITYACQQKIIRWKRYKKNKQTLGNHHEFIRDFFLFIRSHSLFRQKQSCY